MAAVAGLIARANALHAPIRSGSVQTVVSSPPYWGLRRYGWDNDNEIGIGDLADYIAETVAVFRELDRVTDDDAVIWWNVGDTSAKSGGAGGDYNKGGQKHGRPKYRQGKSGLPGPQWSLAPFRAMIALQDEGWLVRAPINWEKGAIRRGDHDFKHTKRPGLSHEYIFMVAKKGGHRWNADALVEKGSTWHFAARPERSGHQAPFPMDLPMRCIPLTTDEGDVVLDPFVGSGTTIKAARVLKRTGIGLDLYAHDYHAA